MQDKLTLKRKRLLQRISRDKYKDMIRYIEKVYLADYDLKILMARKFSNLFMTLLPLALREDGSRLAYRFVEKFRKKKKPIIISDRALIALKEQITSGACRRILLADDIIIHGRTLDKVYRMIQSWFEEGGIKDYEIKVFAYAESENGLLPDIEFANCREVQHVCPTGQWRAISNRIVDIFYLCGTAYTSYVPNLRISMDSEIGRALKIRLESTDSGFISQASRDMRENYVNAYVYVDTKAPAFALNCSMRVYEYKELSEYVLVPMVMLKPMKKQSLMSCLEQVRPLLDERFADMLQTCQEDDILYRSLVYAASAAWGWQFIWNVLNIPPDRVAYQKREEQLNFFHPVLNRKQEATGQADRVLATLSAKFQEIEDIDALLRDEEDFKILTRLFGEAKSQFGQGKTNEDPKETCMLLSKYLYLNGLQDEKRCQERMRDSGNLAEGDLDTRRLIGLPVYQCVEMLSGSIENRIRSILYAIDFGKGSIISWKLRKNQDVYFLSVIHAGEQNYKYYENEYFPFLYGLYHLEYMAEKKQRRGQLKQWKDKFLKTYTTYWIEKKHFFLEDDIMRLGNMEVKRDYGRAILEAPWARFSHGDTIRAMEIAKEITG